MSSATPPPIQAFSHEVQSVPIPVGGWLLYFCISLTIFGPITMVGWMQKTSSPILITVLRRPYFDKLRGWTGYMGENIFRFPLASNRSRCALAIRIFSGLSRYNSGPRLIDQLRFCKTRDHKCDDQYLYNCGFVLLFPLLLARSENVWPQYMIGKKRPRPRPRNHPFARTLNRIYP
jgi:hypothetical protein